jgi:8-oxo-dGTP diphosphatase
MAGKTRPSRAAGPIQSRREISAGGLIWRRRPAESKVEIVLVRPAGKKTWVLPKGHVEQGEHVVDAAVREAREESGFNVEPGESLGDVSYVYSWRDRPGGPLVRIFKRVYFFLMQFKGTNPAGHDRETDEVVWLDFDEALDLATHKSERELIQKARTILGG